MVVRRLQSKIARHLIGVPFIDFTSLTSTLFSVGEGIARALWTNSFPTDPKGKKLSIEQSHHVYTVSSLRLRVPKCSRAAPRPTEAYSTYPRHHHT